MSAPLEFNGVSAGYDGCCTLGGITAEFPAGTVTGLVGPNGAGKTTLLRAALGIVPVHSGTVRVMDRPLEHWSREGLARQIAYLPQKAVPQWPVSALTLVALGRLPHRFQVKSLPESDAKAVETALARCDASAFAERRVDELSSGELARVLLARALATQAPVLLADEPAAHLDPAHQLQLMELLCDEAARGGAIVVTLHDLALAGRFCDRIIVLDGGRIAAGGSPHAALDETILRDVFRIAVWNGSPDTERPVVPWRRL